MASAGEILGISKVVIDAYKGSPSALKILKSRSSYDAYGIADEETCRIQISYCEKLEEYGAASFFSHVLIYFNNVDGLKNLERLAVNNAYCAYMCAMMMLESGYTTKGEKWLKFAAELGHIYSKKEIFIRSNRYNFPRKFQIYILRLYKTIISPYCDELKNTI